MHTISKCTLLSGPKMRELTVYVDFSAMNFIHRRIAVFSGVWVRLAGANLDNYSIEHINLLTPTLWIFEEYIEYIDTTLKEDFDPFLNCFHVKPVHAYVRAVAPLPDPKGSGLND